MSEVKDEMTVREVPSQRWGAIALGALTLFVVALGIWEWRLRALQVLPGDLDNDADTWAEERRKLDAPNPPPIVILGSSRILFTTRFADWEAITGIRPLMLAIPGTAPRAFLHDIAANTPFDGLVVVGVDPRNFFSDRRGLRADWLGHQIKQTPAQRVGHAIFQPLQRFFGFLDPDYKLFTLLERVAAPQRLGECEGPYFEVWKLSRMSEGREVRMWSRIETDAELREHARAAWCVQRPRVSDANVVAGAIAQVREDVQTIRGRGGEVVFIRAPVAGPFLASENRDFPRAATWDRLLAETGSFGIHFEDYPEMQGLELPEWSHLTDADAHRFTRAYVAVLQREMAERMRTSD